MFPLCAENGISQIVWSPLAQGVLTGKYAPGEEPPSDSRAASEAMGCAIERYMDDRVLEAVQRLRPIADEAGLTMAAARARLGPAPRRARLGDHRRLAPRAGARQRRRLRASSSRPTCSTAIDEALGDVAITSPEPAGFAKPGVKHRG